ncbi:uncharacterized protein BO97DRAFT_459902 [Aspergillus homomorphus CBS 101889]|uniref:Uncharacterized protein n=1 Tax=Aspergillus homomorphus (strain CBS 101889) TaxID=1450537 RepID=A0A395HPY3_ASPHC|nr:hypothetical protein BO97DRAFT_459902 [Aspergillus homomorphus CBS 101889]RAL08918.1 hypothetical protein BO97DRAFT_459902 [Aspergillus homomorphus CBS 101889]
MSDGAATDFSWQHDACWRPNDTMALFISSAKFENDLMPEAQGVAPKVDVPARQVWLQTSYRHLNYVKSGSRGNVDVLLNGNILVGWGHSAAYTQYTPDGTSVISNMHFGRFTLFSFRVTNSYRVFQRVFGWKNRVQIPLQLWIDGRCLSVGMVQQKLLVGA